VKISPRELFRITLSLTTVCAIGAGALGALYSVTDRYQRASQQAGERRAIAELLGLAADARVTPVRQFLDPARGQVIYRVGEPAEGAAVRELVFTLDGVAATRAVAADDRSLVPLGRLFVAERSGAPAGFVVEGIAQGYKNRIRFLIGVAPDFTLAGVRVLEHEEDPGLGAEVATPEFQGQFIGREAAGLDVVRDPMPEDWRTALRELRRESVGVWQQRHPDLIARERGRPIYAVTGATISSRALTSGVRATLEHFRRRWALLGPRIGGAS
jgi:electron transport complex protein RnfG